jgi:hypothetical protein
LPGAISGHATDANTHEPIEALEVCAYPLHEENEEEWFCAKTDASGQYEIAQVPAGEWGVEFWGRPVGYVIQYWEDKARSSEADPIEVESTPVTGIDAELTPGSEIDGTVRSSGWSGIPLVEVEVCAWSYPEEFLGGCASTDAAGEYAIRGLPPAEYEISFYPWGSNFLSQYYDHKEHPWEADLLPVGEAEVVSGIDADLDVGAEVAGSVFSNATAAPLASIYVCAIEAEVGELQECAETDKKGRYLLGPLPDGNYKIVFSINFEEWYEEEFGGEEDDGYPTQYWNNQTTLAAANVISLASGDFVSGIDARLGPLAPQPLSSGSVQVPLPPSKPLVTKPLPVPLQKHCRKGFKRKKVKGKVRCVRRKKHHHRRHATSSASEAAVPSALRPLFAR